MEFLGFGPSQVAGHYKCWHGRLRGNDLFTDTEFFPKILKKIFSPYADTAAIERHGYMVSDRSIDTRPRELIPKKGYELLREGTVTQDSKTAISLYGQFEKFRSELCVAEVPMPDKFDDYSQDFTPSVVWINFFGNTKRSRLREGNGSPVIAARCTAG